MKTLSPFVATPPPLPTQPSRSRFVTGLGWLTIVISALLIPISLITLLMIIAGSQGTQSATVSGFISVVLRPPATLIAGIGLLRRWRWSYSYSLALLASFAMWHVTLMVRGPIPEHSYISPGGVPTTTLATGVDYPLHLAALAITVAVFLKLTKRPVRAEFGYGVRSAGRPRVSNTATPPPLSPSQKPSSVSRFIKGITHLSPALRPPMAAIPSLTAVHDTGDISSTTLAAKRRSQHLVLLTVIAIMTVIAAGLGWLVYRGLETGETFFPSKSASRQRTVLRSQEPVVFYISISIYAALCAGSGGLAAWGMREAFRRPTPPRVRFEMS